MLKSHKINKHQLPGVFDKDTMELSKEHFLFVYIILLQQSIQATHTHTRIYIEKEMKQNCSAQLDLFMMCDKRGEHAEKEPKQSIAQTN